MTSGVIVSLTPHTLGKAADVNAAFLLCYPAANVSTFANSLMGSVSSAAFLAGLGMPAGSPGGANGVAVLDGSGLLSDSQIPTAIARLASPSFTGAPQVPTAPPGTNTVQVASTAFVQAAIAALSSVYQAASALLSSIAGLASNGLIARTASGTVAARTITAGTGVVVTNGDGVSGNPTIAVDVGTAAGKVVQLDGSAKLPAVDGSQLTNLPAAGGVLKNIQTFTSSGTYTPTVGATRAKITIIGGGGGGAGSNTAAGGGSGGGAGASIVVYLTSLSSQAVTIGAGGTGGTAGNSGSAGGTTSFGSSYSASGGGFGTYTSGVGGAAAGGSGGTATTGTGRSAQGGSGSPAWTYSVGARIGGNGGASLVDGGGAGIVNGPGTAGNGKYGSGGGGASGTASAGGNGGDGLVIIEEFA
ncbi:hypothetical protein LMIY3S_03706 [Labrys miyagiensis]